MEDGSKIFVKSQDNFPQIQVMCVVFVNIEMVLLSSYQQ